MKVVIADHAGTGNILKVIENQDHHPLIGEKVVLSCGVYMVVVVAWAYSFAIPCITVFVEPWSVE